MRNLIVGIGYEKCGTTTAHDILSKSPLISSPVIKETNFFNRSFNKGFSYYQSLYEHKDSAHFMLDITPGYHNNKINYSRIKTLFPEPIVVLFLRDPIRRAFSMYWHDITFHYAVGDRTLGPAGALFEKPFDKKFCDIASGYNYYLIDLYNSMSDIYNAFGKENTTIVYFDEISSGDFIKKIQERINEDLEIPPFRIWSNSKAPTRYHLKNSNNGINLVLLRGNIEVNSWSIEDLGWETIGRLLEATQFWSKFVSAKNYNEIYESLYKGMDLEAIGVDRDRLFQPGDILHG